MRKKILVADDDPHILEALQIILEGENYEVITTDGKNDWHMLDALPDLILLDVCMSGVDGLQVCKYLKKQTTTRQIPVVMISASTDLPYNAKKAGAEDYIEKPFELEKLLQKVAKYVGRQTKPIMGTI